MSKGLREHDVIKKIVCLFTFIFIFHLLSFSPALGEDPRILIGRDYYDVIKDNLGRAKDDIVVAMYFIIEDRTSQNDLVRDLVNELIKAHLRGVKVKVILENDKFKESRVAYERLAQAGLEVYFDSADKLLHCKVAVIDNELIFIGSTNWTKAAFENNYETACLFQSKEKAREIKRKLLDRISLNPSPPVNVEENGLEVPSALILSEEGLSRLVRERSEKAFDLYLLLLKEKHQKEERIYLNYQDISRKLGYPVNQKKQWLAREKVRRPALLLAKTYGLIEYNDIENWVVITSLETSPHDFPQSISIPFSYWEYGLDNTLSLSAKYMYLVTLLETKRSTRKPYWFRSQEDMASLYHLSDYTISLSLQELEKEDLLEITRSISTPGKYGERHANVYCFNPVVSPSERAGVIDGLKIKYGEDTFRNARDLSRELNEPNDAADIETFILLIRTYGYQTVLKANKITAKYKKGSGLFNITTTINYLRSLRKSLFK